MTVLDVIGAVNEELPAEVGETLLNDADSATTFEQVRWLRSSVLVTPDGRLFRKRSHQSCPHPDSTRN